MEKTIETKQCKKCSVNFKITDKDLEFYNKISPVFEGKKYEIPSPDFCPDCRQQRRLTFRNEGKLYHTKCSATGKNIISAISPDKNYIIYDKKFYITDKWEPLDYGINFNFDKTFFENFDEFLHKVPIQSLSGGLFTENSEYINFSGKVKDCYMVFASWDDEKIFYSSRTNCSNNSMNCLNGFKLSNCFEIYNGTNSYNLKYCINTNNSRDSSFLINCENCENCFLSNNLVGKKYFIKNKEFSKKEYFEKIKILEKKYFNIGWESFSELNNEIIYKNLIMINTQNSFGDNIENSKNCYSCFNMVGESQDCKFLDNGGLICADVYDGIGVGDNLMLSYEIIDSGANASKNYFLISCYTCQNTLYSINCHNSENLFGCVGLRNKQYCILNKQYTKEEYNKLVPQIIEHMKKTGEWGEFFPSSISPFGYNETVAQEYFPLEKEDAINGHLYNFNWSDYESPKPKVEKIIPASKLPENIVDIPDDILNWAIECEVTKKPFRIIKQELEFYRKHNLPIPRKHPDQRHLERMELRNPRKLFDRKCDKCSVDMKTTYSPERDEIVYCEKCYEKEIY